MILASTIQNRKCNALTLLLISRSEYHVVVFFFIVQCICINLNIVSYSYCIRSAFVLFITLILIVVHLSVFIFFNTVYMYICYYLLCMLCDTIVVLQLFVEVKALLYLCYIIVCIRH